MIHKWLLRHPRYHLHFTPTSASWLNQVERWFAEITNKQIRRGSYRSTRELEQAIDDYLAVYNEAPKPFIWTKSADDILESLQIYCTSIIDTGHYGLVARTLERVVYPRLAKTAKGFRVLTVAGGGRRVPSPALPPVAAGRVTPSLPGRTAGARRGATPSIPNGRDGCTRDSPPWSAASPGAGISPPPRPRRPSTL